MKKYIIYTLILIEVVILGYLVYIRQVKSDSKDIENISSSNEDIYTEEEIITIQESEEYILKQSGWLPPWYFEESVKSFKSYSEIMDVANPVVYGINPDGTLLTRIKGVKEFVSYCNDVGISVIPTIGSYGYESMNVIFSNESSYREHIQDILYEVDIYNYDGIDIDYEVIGRDKKDMYISFLKELALELDTRGKILSVTVFAQWSDTVGYTDHADTRYVQDYSMIGDIADEVRIMTYDYTLPSSTTPGPNSPISWVENVIQYSLERIPKDKIWLGIPLYGYRWKDGKALALTQSSLVSFIDNIDKEYRGNIGEVYSEYSCGNTKCYLYYIDSKGINIRRELAKEYNLAGVSYWSIGKDGGILLEVN